MNKIEIYTNRFCIYCYYAKGLLKKAGLEYEEIRVGGNPELREALVEKYGWRTLPVIAVNGRLIGGFSELAELERSGGIKTLLSKNPE